MPIDVHAADSRFVTEIDGRHTAHSFSFGPHYDPENLSWGALLVHNDELLHSGAGYTEHSHANAEIVTWVVSGALRHTDGLGNERILEAGQVQVLSAGAGVVHSEMNAVDADTRFIQTWVRPDAADLAPSCVAATVELTAEWAPLAGGSGLPLHTAGCTLWGARLPEGTRLALPDQPRLHVFVVEGAVGLGERAVFAGGAARIRKEGGRSLTAHADSVVLVWAQTKSAFKGRVGEPTDASLT